MKNLLRSYYQESEIGFYIFKPVANFYHFFLMDKYLSQKRYLEKKFKKYFGYPLDLSDPKTLNEKISWLKLNHASTKDCIYADKYAVRDYIKGKIGEEYLVPIASKTEKPKDIIPENLPDYPCIIKVNHNSSGGIIIRDKYDDKINWNYIQCTLRWNMSENYYWNGREPQYRNIKPLIIVEKLLTDNKGNIPFDYKFHYFNGKLAFVQVDSDRLTNHKRNLYSTDWEHLDCEWEYPKGEFIEKPVSLEKMKQLGKIIAEDFVYVRVDFYALGAKVFFGELTFHSDGGIGQFKPHKYDLQFGEMLTLPNT